MNTSAAICALLLSSMQPAVAELPPRMAWAAPLNSPARSSNNICGTTTTAPSSLSGRFVPRTSKLPTAAARLRRPAIALSLSDQKEADVAGKSLFIFGVGYVATAVALTFLRKGWTVHGTCTDPRKVKSLQGQGIEAYIFDDWSGPMMEPEPLEALSSATCILSTVPPALQSGTDPVLAAHMPELQWGHRNGSLQWLGYLSSTGVYGDRGGGWVTEEDEPWPAAPRTKARLKAERSWLRLHKTDGIPAHVLRLAGIYGPGRSALDSVARHNGDIRLAGSDDGTMVSRIHVADIVSVVESSIERPEPGMVMNVADDLPSTRYETLAYGCKLLGYPRQDPDPSEKYVNRRGGGNKRVDNGKMRALLAASGRPLLFPDYRVGLRALLEGDSRPLAPSPDPTSSVGDDTLWTTPTTTTEIAPFAIPSSREYAEGAGRVEAELKALSSQVSRLEASLDKVLAAVAEKGAHVAHVAHVAGVGGAGRVSDEAGAGKFAGDDDAGGAEGVAAVDESRKPAEEDGEEEVLQVGGSQLDDSYVDVDSSSSTSIKKDELLLVEQAGGKALSESIRAVIEQLFSKFSSFFFPGKTGKTGKVGNISKLWKFNGRQNIWNA